MGYVSSYDTDDEHEGWIAMTYADGAVSSGTSTAHGHYLEGYTYLEGAEIDPSYLRPFSEVVGWLPKCECGWVGIEVPVTDEPNQYREPSDEQENLIMYQWRLHLREAIGAYSDAPTRPNGI